MEFIPFSGRVTPPADMIAAARNSLDDDGFVQLMHMTGGTAPTPAQLVALVEERRAKGYRLPGPVLPETRNGGSGVAVNALFGATALASILAALHGADPAAFSLAALGFATTLRNNRLDQITSYVGASGLLRIYSGSRPSTGGAVGAAVLLAQLTLNSTFAGPASNGVLTLNAISPASSAAATGQATWFRVVRSDGSTFCFDGSVSTIAQGSGDLRLDDVNIVLGGTVAISNGTITEGNA